MRVADSLFGIASTKQKLTLFLIGIWSAVFLFFLPKLLGVFDITIDRFGLHEWAIAWTVLGYLLLATNEEILKILWGYLSYIREHLTRNDLILYSILVAVWFAFGENIIYLMRDAWWAQWWTSLSIGRWLTGFLVHAIFSGSIAYMYMKLSSNKTFENNKIRSFFLFLFSFFLGLVLHLSYNLLLHYGIILGYLLYIIWGYLLLSYLFYRSDRVYLSSWTQTS